MAVRLLFLLFSIFLSSCQPKIIVDVTDASIASGSLGSDGPVHFGEVANNLVYTKTKPITNNGQSDIKLGDISNSGFGLSAPFELLPTSTCTTGQELLPGATCFLDFKFSPTSLGLVRQDFVINFQNQEGSKSFAWFADGTAVVPAVTINQNPSQTDPIATLPISFSVIFNHPIDPASFTIADITQTGTATGITWVITNSGDDTNFTLTAIAIGVEGTVIPVILAGAVVNTTGDTNTASTSTDNTVKYDLTGPTVVINQSGTQPGATQILPIAFTVGFNEPIDPATFTIADITQSGTATGVVWVITNTGDNQNFIVTAVSVATEGTIIPSIGVGTVTDVLGFGNSVSTSTDNIVIFDLTGPDVTINQAAGQSDPTNTLLIVFDVVFSEAINPATFTAADITEIGSASGITWSILNSGDDQNFTLSANAITGIGTVVPTIGMLMVQDPAGNNNTISTSTDNSVLYDNSGPGITINQAGAQADPAIVLPVLFNVVFSKVINPATFTVADITQNGTAAGVTWTITNSGDNFNFTLRATVSGQGTLVPSIAVNRLQDPLGNNNTVSTSTDNTVLYDSTGPSVTVNQAGAQAGITNALPIVFDVVFNEAINPATFTAADITQSGTATGITWSLSTSNNINYTLSATAIVGAGTVIPSIGVGLVQDPLTNTNAASTSTDNTVIYDLTIPTVTVNQAAAQVDPINFLPVNFTVVFSEAINPATFTTADITQSGTATGIIWSLSTGDNITYNLSAMVVTGPGTLVPSIAINSVQDVAGNNNTASTLTDNSVLYDLSGPTVTVNQAGAQVDPINSLPINFTVVFSEAINPATFTAADITQSGTATGITWSLSTGDNITYNLSATVVTGQGTLVPSIAINLVQDVSGNNCAASTSTDNSVRYDSAGPTVTVNQAGGQIDPINSLPIDFTVVFSEAINPATFTAADITQSGTATGITWSLSTGDNITFNLSATVVTGQGTLVPSIAINLVQDVAGNNSAASTSTDNSVRYDISGPTVTVNQAGGQLDPINSLPINFTVVFSEAINPATFTAADISQVGSANVITWSVSTGDNITFNLSAILVGVPGTLIPSIAINLVQDVAGNNSAASTSTDNSVLYDTTAPTVTVNQAGGQPDPAAALPASFTVVFSEAINPATFTTADITQSGTATGITWSLSTGDNITYTLNATVVTGQGTLIPSIAINLVQDVAGNNSAASTSTDNSVLYDNAGPSITVNQAGGQVDPINSLPISFTVVFSEAINPATFTTADITQSGTATGITWSLSTGDNITYTLNATVVTGPGTLIPSIAINLVQDVFGNNSAASTSTDNSVRYDTTIPTVTVNQAGGQLDPINALPISFTVVFSEAINPATFTTADITQSGTATGITWSLSTGDNITYTLNATAVTGPGTLIPSIAINLVQDVAGNNSAASTSTDNSVRYDTAGPTVTVNQAGGQSDPINALPISFTVVFSEAINPATFTTADITQSGTATGITWSLSTGDNITYTLNATVVTGQGTLIPSIAINLVQDVSGNNSAASTSTDNSVRYDTTIPTVTVNQAGGQSDPINALPISFTVVFSEAINPATFTTADITQSGTATGITWSLSTGDNITYTLNATVVTGPGTLIPSIAINLVQDVAGNNSAASTSTDNSVRYDTTGPTVTVNQAGGQSDPINALPISFTVVFSEAINPATFTTADITQSGTATGITWSLSTGDNITYTLNATVVTGQGTLIPSIAINLVQDVSGNNSAASTSTDNSVRYDTTAPTVTVNQAGGQLDPINSLPISFTVVFSEAITPATFTSADITQSGTATGITWSISTGDNITFTLNATVVTGQGTLIPSIAINRVQDPAGNNNAASSSTDNSVRYDTSGPTVTVNQAGGQLDPINSLPISFTVVFSEAITPATFTSADITQSGTATGITWSISTGDNITFTLNATVVTGQGTLIPSIAINRVQDPAGNNNAASSSTDNSVRYDTTAPTVTVNQAGGQLDPINSLPISFTVVFSEAITPATFTSADITQSGTATGITWSISTGDNITFTLNATVVTGQGTLIPSIAINRVQDPAGNNNAASTSTDNSVRYDTSAPTVTVNQAGGQADPAPALPVNFTVVFSEAINPATFTTADITQSGTATGITWSLSTGDNITYNLSATVVTGQGTLVPSIAINLVQDVAGNNNAVSTSTDNSVLYDITGPTVTVNQAGGQLDPINSLPISFNVVFSEAINPATFDALDITQNGTATGVTWATSTGDNINFTVTAIVVTGQGTVIPSIAINRAQDLAGNNNAASTSTDNSVLYDTTAPTVTVNQPGSQLDPVNVMPINFNVLFSENINPATFTVADITHSGTATGITWAIFPTDNMTFTLCALFVGTPGTFVPSIAMNLVQDAAGNNNAASTSTDNTVRYDNTAPSVTINQAGGQADPANAVPVDFTVVFNEGISGATFTTADITQSGTATGITWSISGGPSTFTLSATVVTGAGTLIPSIGASTVQDPAGNNNTVSTSTDNSVTYSLPAVLEWDFTTYPYGTSNVNTNQTFTLENTGGGISSVITFSIGGADPTKFADAGGSCVSGVTILDTGETCTLNVTTLAGDNGQTAGAYTALLSATAATGGTDNVSLSYTAAYNWGVWITHWSGSSYDGAGHPSGACGSKGGSFRTLIANTPAGQQISFVRLPVWDAGCNPGYQAFSATLDGSAFFRQCGGGPTWAAGPQPSMYAKCFPTGSPVPSWGKHLHTYPANSAINDCETAMIYIVRYYQCN